MFRYLPLVLAVALLFCIPCEVQAGPLGIFPNFYPIRSVAKAAGKVVKGAAGAIKAVRPRARARGC